MGLAERPELVRCDFLLNEGGGEVLPVGSERSYAVSIGEKGVFRFTLTTDGVASHASVPMGADNALLKLAPLLDAMATGATGLGRDPRRSSRALLPSRPRRRSRPRRKRSSRLPPFRRLWRRRRRP